MRLKIGQKLHQHGAPAPSSFLLICSAEAAQRERDD